MIRTRSGQITINLAHRRLSHYEGNRLNKTYPVGVGKSTTPTPMGSYSIVTKVIQPGGMLGAEMDGPVYPHR